MSDLNLILPGQGKAVLIIDPKDNVAVALADLKIGDLVISGMEGGEIKVNEDIPFGHKIALKPLLKDESVMKYGEEIGKMTYPVEIGCWIHNHNMYCERGLSHGR
jgi:altronate dehydratase small subunit